MEDRSGYLFGYKEQEEVKITTTTKVTNTTISNLNTTVVLKVKENKEAKYHETLPIPTPAKPDRAEVRSRYSSKRLIKSPSKQSV